MQSFEINVVSHHLSCVCIHCFWNIGYSEVWKQTNSTALNTDADDMAGEW